ncbi:MAG: tRNA (adenosine(37)-N6)-dimethylallyltransferase MiaA [Planctomycetaceae bacterium]
MQIPVDILQACWFLAGPTACGKTATSLELAKLLGAEIVSLDSMALYRGMDIGTAKPSAAERAAVPHHLIDVIEPHQEYSLAEYVAAAASICKDILARGRVPLFVGGTGLYLRGVLRGFFDGPAADWTFRRRLEAEADEQGEEFLHESLQLVDPATARRLHPRDTRRIVRALEVFHVTGKPLSEQQKQTPLPVDLRPAHVYWLHPPRDWLYERIDRRVEQMFAAGLVDEVRALLEKPEPMSRTARQGLGYKEVIDHLEGGCSLAQTIRDVQTRTRQFAKRQHTWFRNLEECREVAISGAEAPWELAKRIWSGKTTEKAGLP